MKRLHLICNAHLDPAWMWDFPEGLTAALATFRSAANLSEEYDFIFCHNEVILYEWIEEHDPALFARIVELVKAGKWHIMGGWYLQPDCHMPSGESFVRQILAGQRYFQEKFGVRPTTAINFDSFGHSRGLVQILNKCGYDSYLICRPMPQIASTVLPDNQFNWVGYDGSKIKCCRIGDEFMYTTDKAQAKTFIPKKAECWMGHETGVALWGIGNHGGGPSRIDLADVGDLIAETKDYQILHSTPEKFFSEVHPTADYDGTLAHFLVGCYSSVSSIKQAHIELENKLFATEKICAIADMNGHHDVWDEKAFREAEKVLLTIEFHDVLCGTTAEDGVRTTLEYAKHAVHLLNNQYTKAFLRLMEDETPTDPCTYPIVVFNPAPYEIETVVEVEFLNLSAIASDTERWRVILTRDGVEIPHQILKELSNINYDRRKRVAFKAKLKPMGTTRFVATTVREPLLPKAEKPAETGDIVWSDACKTVRISRRTGLLESLAMNGKEYLAGGAFQPVMYDEIADTWGWYADGIGINPQPFTLDDCSSGAFEGYRNVAIVEDGDILTEVESFFRCGDSKIRLSYKLYRDLPYIDVSAIVLWNEQHKTLKLQIPSAIKEQFVGQTSYGTDVFEQNGNEEIAHRFMSMREGNTALSVINNCVYGCSAKDGVMSATLLRGVGHCVHIIEDRPLLKDETRFIDYPETGKHFYKFRLAVHDVAESENLASVFCQPPYALNAFPAGQGVTSKPFTLDNRAVTLSAMYKDGDHTVIRLFNNNAEKQTCTMSLGDVFGTVTLGAYEIKTVYYQDGCFEEQDRIL